VQEVFALVKRRSWERGFPERSGGALGGDLGCRGKGRQPLYPLLLSVVETWLLFFLFLFILGWGITFFTHRVSPHLDAMGIVN